MIKKIALTAALLTSTAGFATPTWNRLHSQYNLSTNQHAFCFTDSNGELIGANPHLKVRIASVSKLATTLWAIDKKTPQFQYETFFYFKDGHLHIKGSRDTVFSRRKLFYLVNQLNQQGIKKIDSITFDDKTIALASAEDYVGEVLTITPTRTAANLKDFLHTKEWNVLKPVYRDFINSTPASLRDRYGLRALEELSLDIGQVSASNTAPFDVDGSGVTKFSLLSSAIEDYMKFMNIVSNNFIADQTFENLGGEAEFDKYIESFMNEHFKDYETKRTGFSSQEPSFKMFTGSGLNTNRNGTRVDNYASCAIIVKLIEVLDEKMQELDSVIQKIAAVPAADGGTFRKRLNSPVLKNSIVAKTGTLFHTSALAGLVSTQKGVQYFGIFHQLQGSKANANLIQNQMVRTLIDQGGGPKTFTYSPEYFFPVAK